MGRIVMYSQDSFGLGHLRRLTNLANSLVEQREDLSILLIVDSPVAPFFDLGPRIDFVKLPTVVKIGAGVFRSGRLLTDYEQVKNLRSTILREVVGQFVPDVLLVDHMPGGANRELLPALQMIRRRGLPTRVILGLRDIIDAPEVTRSVWRRERAYEIMKRNYHHVLIYGAPDVFATADEYGFARVMGERVQYCGYVCNMDAVRDTAHVRAKLELGAEPIVAVMAGGGADAFLLMRTFLLAARHLGARRTFSTLMVTGPFMPEEERKELRDLAREVGVQVRTSVGDSMTHIHAADVVVSMAGYNTLTEILRFGKRAVIVPRPGPSAEQGMRARLFAARGLIDVIEQKDLVPETLAAALESALSAPVRTDARGTPALDGVVNATSVLLGALGASSNGVPSVNPLPMPPHALVPIPRRA